MATIKDKRISKGWNQVMFAKKLKVSQQLVSRIEKENKASVKIAFKISKLFGGNTIDYTR